MRKKVLFLFVLISTLGLSGCTDKKSLNKQGRWLQVLETENAISFIDNASIVTSKENNDIIYFWSKHNFHKKEKLSSGATWQKVLRYNTANCHENTMVEIREIVYPEINTKAEDSIRDEAAVGDLINVYKVSVPEGHQETILRKACHLAK